MANENGHMAGALLGLHAQTSLHPGAGTALGAVDLPVQRERHTQWPTIAGSSLKGILRDACREHLGQTLDRQENWRQKANEDPQLTAVFGPPQNSAHEQAGAMAVTDARLLAFPVRSLCGVYAWATCPAVLRRLVRDVSLVDMQPGWKIPDVELGHILTAEESPCRVAQGDEVVLEEFSFRRASHDIAPLTSWICEHVLPASEDYASTRAAFTRQLVILSDDDFTHFARWGTEINARIGIDYETKTVAKGALFYQEFLPPETLLYSLILTRPARSGNGGLSGAQVLQFVQCAVPGVLQIGGDESIGKGICRVCFSSKETM